VAPPVQSRRAARSTLTSARALSSCSQYITAVHIKDPSLGKLEHGATPGCAPGGAMLARTLLTMPLPEDFRLQTCARLLIAVNSPTD
jgi:hypothetical protein